MRVVDTGVGVVGCTAQLFVGAGGVSRWCVGERVRTVLLRFWSPWGMWRWMLVVGFVESMLCWCDGVAEGV